MARHLHARSCDEWMLLFFLVCSLDSITRCLSHRLPAFGDTGSCHTAAALPCDATCSPLEDLASSLLPRGVGDSCRPTAMPPSVTSWSSLTMAGSYGVGEHHTQSSQACLTLASMGQNQQGRAPAAPVSEAHKICLLPARLATQGTCRSCRPCRMCPHWPPSARSTSAMRQARSHPRGQAPAPPAAGPLPRRAGPGASASGAAWAQRVPGTASPLPPAAAAPPRFVPAAWPASGRRRCGAGRRTWRGVARGGQTARRAG
jgi:hypothetical protein